MSDFDPGIHPPHYRLPAATHVGRARLAVSNLAASLAFYRDVIGLAVRSQNATTASLGPHGSEKVLLELEQLPGVQPIRMRSRLGLYHTAILLPSETDLASFVRHLAGLKTEFGAADHLYSQALYLTDPDGLQVEVYADRPRESWQHEGQEIIGATKPIHFEGLPKVAEGSWRGAPAGTVMGHMHFYIGDLEQAKAFYHAALGLDIVTWRYPGALFTSVGGYHHHVGLNIWAARASVATEQDARLLDWELVLPTAEDVAKASASLSAAGFAGSDGAFTDPWGIRLKLVSGGSMRL